MADDLGVEGISGEAEAGIAQQVSGGAAAAQNRGTNSQQREVAGAAAEVSNQNELVAVERGFVVARGGDGLQFKLDRFESRGVQRFRQALLGVSIVVVSFGADELHGASDDGGVDAQSELRFGIPPQVFEDAGDERDQRVPASENFGRDQGAAAEEGLQRLHQASSAVGGEVVLNALGPAPRLERVRAALFDLLEIKQRAVGVGGRAEFGEVREFDVPRAGRQRDRAVGGAEIDADGGGGHGGPGLSRITRVGVSPPRRPGLPTQGSYEPLGVGAIESETNDLNVLSSSFQPSALRYLHSLSSLRFRPRGSVASPHSA